MDDCEYQEKELLEMKLFGIWLPRHISRHRKMVLGDTKLKRLMAKAFRGESFK
jgi:hypothetical protein